MTESMSKIQQCTLSLFGRIVFNDIFLYDVAFVDHLSNGRKIKRCNLCFVFLQPYKIIGILDQTMLDDLAHTRTKLAVR